MIFFDKIIELSKKIASSLLKGEKPADLENSDILTGQDKKYVLHNLTNKDKINERRDLKERIDPDIDWKKVSREIGRPSVINIYWKYMAAASVGLVMALAFFYGDQDLKIGQDTPVVTNHSVHKGTDKAVLTVEDGSQVALEKGKVYQSDRLNSNGEKLIYNPDSKVASKVLYNYLTVPRGGQFFVELSDGTKVWLNSESKLKYPVAFKSGATREVELIYGEAYFDVSSSKEHNGDAFAVLNDKQEVHVLGTEFNIKAYSDEKYIKTTLVEGSVKVTNDGKEHNLVPNEQLTFDIENNTQTVATVDVYSEISWKDGIFSFDRKSLKEIMKVLSRWYDVDVEFENKALEDVKFVGVIGKGQDIDEILLSIKNFGVINNYEINDKTVLIK